MGPSHFGEKFYENDAQSTGSFIYLLPLTLLFTISLLLASLVRSAALICLIAHSFARSLIRRRFTSKNRMRRFHITSTTQYASAQLRNCVPSFARTAHSFACSTLLASIACSAALIRSLARSLALSRAHGKEVFIYELNASISYLLNPLCILSIFSSIGVCFSPQRFLQSR